MNKYLDKAGLQDYTTKLTDKYDDRYATRAMVGSPLVAHTAADMTDTSKVYVYTGTETGYVNGDWYYYDGSAWQDGGVYNSTAVVLDKTLSQPDEAAEAEAVGNALDLKANKKGNYDTLGAGTANNLTTNLVETNGYPFNFAPTGGLGKVIEAANRVFLRKIIYGSVVINQKVQISDLAATGTDHSVTYTNNGDGSYTANGTAEGANSVKYPFTNRAIDPTHVYFCKATPSGGSISTYYTNWSSGVNDTGNGVIVKGLSELTPRFTIVNGATAPTGKWVPQYIDLTKWYGSTETADHIYAMETANAGAGVNFFITQHPQVSGYIPYNVGTLASSKPSFHETSGRNLYDHSTGTAELVGNQTYRIEGAYTALSFTDAGGNTSTITPDANGEFSITIGGVLTVTGGSAASTIVFIHYDDTMNGVFEAPSFHTYPFDSTAEGHGKFKFKKVNNVLTDELYADGDEYMPSGEFKEVWKEFDISELSWGLYEGRFNTNTPIDGISTALAWNVVESISEKYEKATMTPATTAPDKSYGVYAGYLYVKDSTYDTAAAFVAGNVGVKILLKLATPTASTKDPYDEEQACHNWGYEYYNDSEYDAGNRAVQIPVGMVADYPANLKDKLESYPDLPSEDGDHVLTKSGNTYSYKKLASAFPAAPSEAGTYHLALTVADGVGTMSWVADT